MILDLDCESFPAATFYWKKSETIAERDKKFLSRMNKRYWDYRRMNETELKDNDKKVIDWLTTYGEEGSNVDGILDDDWEKNRTSIEGIVFEFFFKLTIKNKFC